MGARPPRASLVRHAVAVARGNGHWRHRDRRIRPACGRPPGAVGPNRVWTFRVTSTGSRRSR